MDRGAETPMSEEAVPGGDSFATPSDGQGAVDIPPAVERALAVFDEIAKKRYRTDFQALAYDSNRRQASARVRQLVGVAVKKDYSDPKEIVTRAGKFVDFKWEVNDHRLAELPNDAWQFEVLKLGARQLRVKSGNDVAKRLRRETLIQRFYFGLIHPYLCQSPEVRREIKAILKQYGLGEFYGLSTPRGLLGAGAAIAVTSVALCVIGLKRICKRGSAA